jgi:hypothetical protein
LTNLIRYMLEEPPYQRIKELEAVTAALKSENAALRDKAGLGINERREALERRICKLNSDIAKADARIDRLLK